MSRTFFHSTLFACLVVVPITAHSAYAQSDDESPSPDGTWKWTSTMGNNEIHSVLRLELDGDTVVGTYENDTIKEEVSNGRLDGDELSLEMSTNVNGRKLDVQWRGTVMDSELNGMVYLTVDGEPLGEGFDWVAKRHVDPQDVEGVWRFEFSGPNGRAFAPVLVIAAKDGKLTGSRREAEGTVDSIELKDGVLTIVYKTMFREMSITLTYTMNPRGNHMDGTLKYEAGGRSGETPVKATRLRLPARARKLVGQWVLDMTGDDGVQRNPVIEFADNEGTLEASMAEGDEDFKIENLKYSDGQVTFDVQHEHEGTPVALHWTLKPEGDNLTGTLAYDAQGTTGEIKVTGKRKPSDDES